MPDIGYFREALNIQRRMVNNAPARFAMTARAKTPHNGVAAAS
jgi:hypothetical protein